MATPITCEKCNKNPASVRVTEITHTAPAGQGNGGPAFGFQESLLCEICAQAMQLPHSPIVKGINILKLLNSARRNQRQGLPTCAGCGMDLEDFRRRGRLGCPKCYEVFKPHVGELLERVHGARQHIGRVPGVSDEELGRLHTLTDLRHKLEAAVREEAYESAARLRDEIQQLEARGTRPESA